MATNWSDPTVNSTTHIRSVHVNQARSVVDQNRVAAGLGAYAWTDHTVTNLTHVRAVHFTELRSAIQDLWNHVGLGALPNWSYGSPPAAGSGRPISARDITDLRSWIQRYQDYLGKSYDPAPQYYGCDLGVNFFPGPSADFYIGQLGYGGGASNQYFNGDAAVRATPNNAYASWFVTGPDLASPRATTPDAAYAWGQTQANLAASARLNAPQPVLRVTLFGDFEGFRGQNGWSSNTALNQAVWTGFYNGIRAQVLSPGLYSTALQWNDIMNAGQGFGIPPGTAVWSADLSEAGGGTGPVPCDGYPTTWPSLPLIGGVAPVIWQYNQHPSCTADLDAAISLP